MDAIIDSTYQERAYNYIRERILSLEFKPNMALRMEALAAAIKVSRTPVREALSRLCEAGLVVRATRIDPVRKCAKSSGERTCCTTAVIEPGLPPIP